ncbi:uncharacterized protein LOC135490024 [Lineus longissimus]|uniref:uncharacterized protein LOC135490024 n=1 Tax=Lineus longissimus TaxID=88925 RepID=UPI00315CE7F0
MTWVKEFLKNFTHLGKWLRIGEVTAVVLALGGLMFAALSLPLPWFRIEFKQDLIMDELLDTIRAFNKSITQATKELEDFADLTRRSFKDLTCEELAGALAGAAVASFFPGVSQVIKQGMRIAKYMRALGKKMMHYKSLFYKLITLMRKIDGFADMVKKPLLVGVTMENMGMLMFLMPVIITGTIVIFFAFWPRKLRSGNWLQGKKKCCIVLGTATIHLAFNAAGLMLFEWWGPMLAQIADGLPLTSAHLVKESGWALVEAGFGCAIGASFIFFLQAFFSIFRPEPEIAAVPLKEVKTPHSLQKCKQGDNHFGSMPTLYRKKEDKSTTASSSKLAKYSASCSQLDQCTSSGEFNAKLRWKMFRATMMDTAPPRAWCLSLILTFIVLWLSLEAVLQKWVTFDPTMKPKWAKIL